jgi:hypothetical protein
VLNLYSSGKSVCALVRYLQNRPNQEFPIPPIYYLSENGATLASKASAILKKSGVVKFRAAFDNPFPNKEY